MSGKIRLAAQKMAEQKGVVEEKKHVLLFDGEDFREPSLFGRNKQRRPRLRR